MMEKPSIELIHGDCLTVMRELLDTDVKVNLVLTDPPYNISRANNYHTLGQRGIDFGEWDKNFDMYSWLDLAAELVTKDSSFIFFSDWKEIGGLAKHLEGKGFAIKDFLRWVKTNPVPKNRDRRYVSDAEYAVWLTKGKWTFNRQKENFERPEFRGSLTPNKERTGHPTQKPIYLIEQLIKIHSNEGDTILDPFMGSGTTAEVCKKLNRNFIGIELDNDYFNIAKERVRRCDEDT